MRITPCQLDPIRPTTNLLISSQPDTVYFKEEIWNVNPFPNKTWFLRVCCTTLLKTLWEKEKLLVTSNFSFSRNVFYLFEELSAISIEFKIVVCKLFQIVKKSSFGKALNLCG